MGEQQNQNQEITSISKHTEEYRMERKRNKKERQQTNKESNIAERANAIKKMVQECNDKMEDLVNLIEEGEHKEWIHPFAKLREIETAKEYFQQTPNNKEISDDKMHMKTGCGLIKKIYEEIIEECAKADLVLSDSCRCTSYSPDPINYPEWFNEDRDGNEFLNELNNAKAKGKYMPSWGQGLKAMRENIESEIESNPEIKDIVIIIAGNDIQYGKKYCQEEIDKIMKFNPKIISVIPEYSQCDGDEQDEKDEWYEQNWYDQNDWKEENEESQIEKEASAETLHGKEEENEQESCAETLRGEEEEN